MRILLLTDGTYPFAMGGMQKHSFYLFNYLLKNKHDVSIAHCPDSTILDSEITHVSKDIFLSNADKVFALQFPKIAKFPGHYILASWLYSDKLYKHYQANLDDFDLIYAQGFTAWRFLQKRSNLMATPVLVNLHGFEMYQKAYSLKEVIEKFILKIPAYYIIRKADYLQSLGGRITQLIGSVYSKAKVLQCSIGIEESWIRTSINPCFGNQRKFLFIGRMEHRKGLHLLNQLLPTLCNDNRFEMHFIGPIPSEFQINHEQIHYHGKINDETKITEVLDQMDVLLLPSLSEGMPTVILEAMARSCAVIATDVGAVSELVDSSNGVLVPSNDTEALKSAILSILNTSNCKLETLKQASLDRVQNYTWSKVIERQISQFKTTQ